MNIERVSRKRNQHKLLTADRHLARDTSTRFYPGGAIVIAGRSEDLKHTYNVTLSPEDVKRIADHYNETHNRGTWRAKDPVEAFPKD